jgi:Tol biopolymer transport system component
MTTERPTRFERVLPGLFDELADARTPEYLEAAIERASSRPQRPAWTFPGRWLPMDISTRAVPAPRLPWRQLGVLALLTILLAATLAVFVGSQERRLPEPFGLAANGVVAVERDGDIVTVDPATGASETIIGGPEADSDPMYSPDGTKLAFVRAVEGSDDQSLLMVAKADGTDVVQTTTEPITQLLSYSFSADGRELLITGVVDLRPQIFFVPADGAGEPRFLDVRLSSNESAIENAFVRPPDGREVLVVQSQPDTDRRGIYLLDPSSGQTRPVHEPTAPFDLFNASWSPSGEWIMFGQFAETPRAYVIRVGDGSDARRVAPYSLVDADRPGSWSNDSTRMTIGSRDVADGPFDVVVVGIDPDMEPVELDCTPFGLPSCEGDWIWSPDDTQLLGIIEAEGEPARYFVADPDTGVVTHAPWTATGGLSQQRLAPPD